MKAFRSYSVKKLPQINLPFSNIQIGEGHSDDQFSRILKYFYSNQDFYSIKSEVTDQNIWELYAQTHAIEAHNLLRELTTHIKDTLLNHDNVGHFYTDAIEFGN